MEGKSSVDKVPEGNRTEEIESDEVLRESAKITDITEPANEASAPHEKKPETSQMLSDDTSGIEIVSTATTSASEIPHESATHSEVEEPLIPMEPAESELVTSASEIPCEGIEDSDVEDKTEPPSIETDPINELSRSITSAAEIQSEGAESCAEEKRTSVIDSPTVTKTIISDSEVPCQQETSDAAKDVEAAATETSPRPKKGVKETLKKLFSPKKNKKSKESRSKSMSPSKKNKSNAAAEANAAAEESRILSDGEEHVKSDKEKSSKFEMYTKNFKRKISKLSLKSKSSESESISLVPNEAIERSEEPEVPISKTEVETKDDVEESTLNMPRWTKNRTSLTEIQSLGGTTMTDVPSTSSSSVFSGTSSRKPSAVGENTSEEAIASSLVNSLDDEISGIKENKDTVIESEKKDGSSSEQNTEAAAPENADQEQSSYEGNTKCPENNERKSDEN